MDAPSIEAFGLEKCFRNHHRNLKSDSSYYPTFGDSRIWVIPMSRGRYSVMFRKVPFPAMPRKEKNVPTLKSHSEFYQMIFVRPQIDFRINM